MGIIERKKRVMMMQEKSGGLPSEYKQVEYIYSNGGKINLNYVPTVLPKAVITIQFATAIDRDVMGFGSNTFPSFIIDASSNQIGNNARWYNRYGSTSSTDLSEKPYIREKHTWEFGKTVKYDGVTINTYSDIDWNSNTQSFNLLGARTSHTGIMVYDFSLYDGQTLVRRLIPCYRKSDDVVGFYDTISGAFFTSSVGTLSIPT